MYKDYRDKICRLVSNLVAEVYRKNRSIFFKYCDSYDGVVDESSAWESLAKIRFSVKSDRTRTIMAEERKSLLGGSKSGRRRSKPRNYTENGGKHMSIEMSHSSSYKSHSIGGSSRTPRLSDAFEKSNQYEISLAWKQIYVKVNIPGKRGFPCGEAVPPQQKTILRNGEFSLFGSGKSTLLNVLTQRNTKDYIVEGEMLLNGVSLTPGAIRNISAYVQQSDIFMDTLTVREQLQFRALLRMDKKLDKKARLQRVENVIHEMGLTAIANTKIGTPGGKKKGISGGERKRLAFACEALTNPPIFFCDEPMSGLDSFMAQSILVTLRNRPCPSNYNPSDHYILTLAIIPGREAECYRTSGAICDAYERSDHAKQILTEIEEQRQHESLMDHAVLAEVTGENRYRSAWPVQVVNLFWRAWVCQFRDRTLVTIKLYQALALALLMGIIWFQMDIDQKGVVNFNAALLELILTITMNTVLNVITTFPSELALVNREFGTGMYDSGLYFIIIVVVVVVVVVVIIVVKVVVAAAATVVVVVVVAAAVVVVVVVVVVAVVEVVDVVEV
ncbi:ATP-binding cassette sub-family G member [Elysia marginata]|uniref:ATP-binding cassette sub-family G member n=1 Tax=Elysia marginata TaxID=1093978 RepID=A0AAV4G581_9GAST|nr:ATP-binding cassette sub-family G member [Elysia marginata]